MPCRDEPSPEEIHESVKAVRKREKEIKNKIDSLTRMLCNACKILTYHDVEITHPDITNKELDELANWNVNHKKWDKERLAAAKKNALAKLSDEEREALGL